MSVLQPRPRAHAKAGVSSLDLIEFYHSSRALTHQRKVGIFMATAQAVVWQWANPMEHKAYRALARLGIDFIPQYGIDRYRADAFLPKYKVVMEFDDPGHNYEPRRSQDEIRDEFMARLGYYTLRITYKAMAVDAVRGIRAGLESIGIPYSYQFGHCTLSVDEIAAIEARQHMYLSGYIESVGMLFPVFRVRDF